MPGPVLRRLTSSDIPAAMTLVAAAGWNQTPDDWARFLSASPNGGLVAALDGGVVGTAATMVYGRRLAWIGMVIVEQGCRRQGIGRRLLKAACNLVDDAGIACAKLDATPAGEPLYEQMGFVRERRLERWVLNRDSTLLKEPRTLLMEPRTLLME